MERCHVGVPSGNQSWWQWIDDCLISMPMYGGFTLATFDWLENVLYINVCPRVLHSWTWQALFTRAETQVDQEVATQIKQVEATSWIVTAVLKLGQKWGKAFLLVASSMGKIIFNYLAIFSDFLGAWRDWQMGMSSKKGWDRHDSEIEGPKYMGMWT